MKILMLNNEYPPLGGGQAYVNKSVYEKLKNKKYKNLQIDIVTSSNDKEKIEETKLGKIYYLNIGKKGRGDHFQSSKDLIIYSIKSLKKALELNKKNHYDLVVAFSGIPAGFLANVIKKLSKIPYIILLQGSDIPFYEERWKYLDKFIFSWLSPYLWKNASIVNAISKDSFNLARKVYPKGKIEIIYNGVDIERFKPNKTILKQQKSFNVLFVGRLIERKGFNYLFKAFKNIERKYPSAVLHVVGNGPLKKDYENNALDEIKKGKVIFYDVVKHEDLPKIYQKAHVVVLPSLNEALGNVTQEAMASGVPVITTDTGASELINGNGFIVEKKNSEDIEKALEKLILNKNLRNLMATKSRELITKFSWEKVAERYYSMFGKAYSDGKNLK